jgi:hypothetical protein
VEAYTSGAWRVLGHDTWDDYCAERFGTGRLRLPRENKWGTVKSMRDAGLSLRAIEAATGEAKSSIARNTAGVPNGTPHKPAAGEDPAPSPTADRGAGVEPSEAPPAPTQRVQGTDGSSHPKSKPKPPPHPDDVFRGEALKAIDKTNHLLELPAEKVVLLADPQDRDDLARLARDLRTYADDLDKALHPGLKAVN